MAASSNDKLSRVSNGGIPVTATVQANRTAGVNTLSVDTQQYWPITTGIKFSTYKLDSSNNRVAGSQIDWEGVSNGTNQLANIVRTGGAADTGNVVGDKVSMQPTAQWGDDVVAAILAHAAQDGSLLSAAVLAAISAGGITTAMLGNAIVTPSKLNLGPQVGFVATNESTTSGSFTDLTTAGPNVTVTIGPNGLALVFLYTNVTAPASGGYAAMGFAMSGANTVAATAAYSLSLHAGVGDNRLGVMLPLTGLTAGATTFTCKYTNFTGSGTASFADRRITVIPL